MELTHLAFAREEVQNSNVKFSDEMEFLHRWFISLPTFVINVGQEICTVGDLTTLPVNLYKESAHCSA